MSDCEKRPVHRQRWSSQTSTERVISPKWFNFFPWEKVITVIFLVTNSLSILWRPSFVGIIGSVDPDQIPFKTSKILPTVRTSSNSSETLKNLIVILSTDGRIATKLN